MSFGFSVGDFVAVGQLAWKVYRKCKTAPSEFKAISSQLISLHIVIKDVKETIEEWDLSEEKKADLLQIGEDSKGALDELDRLLKKYSSLGMRSSRTLDRLRFPRAYIEELRARLDCYIKLLTSLKTSLVLSSQARLEKMVSQIMAERQQGLREGSVISRSSLAAAEDGDGDVWLGIKRELEDFGTITDAVLNEHRDFIIDLLKSNLSDDDKRGSAPECLWLSQEHCEAEYQESHQNASERIIATEALALTESGSRSLCQSIQGTDDDIGEYLVDDLYDALSFYEMLCQHPVDTLSLPEKVLNLKLYRLGRSTRITKRLTFANTKLWNMVLPKIIDDAEDALQATLPVVEQWLMTRVNEGLWEPGTRRILRLKPTACTTVTEGHNDVADKDILTIKNNLEGVQTAMQESSGLLGQVSYQQLAACQLLLLVHQCEALRSYVRVFQHGDENCGLKGGVHTEITNYLRRRTDMLVWQAMLLQALALYLSSSSIITPILRVAYLTTWRETGRQGFETHTHHSSARYCLDTLESQYLTLYNEHFKLGPQLFLTLSRVHKEGLKPAPTLTAKNTSFFSQLGMPTLKRERTKFLKKKTDFL